MLSLLALSWIKYSFRIQLKLHAELEHFLTLKNRKKNRSICLFLFQSRCASIESTAAIFRQSVGIFIVTAYVLGVNVSIKKHTLTVQVVCMDDVYGGTNRLMNRVFVPNGVKVTKVDCTNLDLLSEALNENVRIVWIETPTNPTMKCVDIEACSKVT